MSSGNIKVIYLILWCVWSVVQSLLLLQYGFSWFIAIPDAFVSNLLLAAIGYTLSLAFRFYQPGPKKALILFEWTIGLAILSTGLLRWLLENLFMAYPSYTESLSDTIYLRFAFSWLLLSFMALLSWLWFYIHEQQEVKNRNEAAEKLARETELSKLRQQLQPHFLFNSLNSISALIVVKPELARKMIQQLSDFLRGTLKKDEHQLVTFAEELQHLQLYLEIEKVRFGHRLKVIVEQEDTCKKMLLPTLLLQPVVENAIKFGLYDTIGETTILIKAIADGRNLVLITENPYDPATAQANEGTGFGLSSVKRRLFLLFARNDLVTTAQNQQTFFTKIKIPQKP